MDRTPASEIDTTFARNLTALQDTDPQLADTLQGIQIPVWVDPCTGRDGLPTFRLHPPGQRKHWLGWSSMPTVSAIARLQHFDSGGEGVNILLPAIAAGVEARALLDRISPRRAVFVYERDLLRIRLALTVRDLSDGLSSGRLVLLTGADAGTAIENFLAAHGGYLFPDRMYADVMENPGGVKVIQRQLERASGSVLENLQKRLDEYGNTIRSFTEGQVNNTCLVMSLSDAVQSVERAGALQTAMSKAGASAHLCVVDSPARVHPVAFVKAIHDHRPNHLVLLDHPLGKLSAILPDWLGVTYWISPGAPIHDGWQGAFRSQDTILAADQATRTRLNDAGIANVGPDLLPLAADEQRFFPIQTLDVHDLLDVALIALPVAVDAESYEIKLDSHAKLWNYALQLVRGSEHLSLYGSADALLRAAESRLGIELKPEEAREHLRRSLDEQAIPAVIAERVFDGLKELGLKVQRFPAGPSKGMWPTPPSAEQRNVIYNRAKVVLVLGGWESQELLDVLSAGGTPLRLVSDSDPAPTDDSTVYAGLPGFATLQELRVQIARLTEDDRLRRQAVEPAIHKVATAHRISHRLAEIAKASRTGGCSDSSGRSPAFI